MSTDEYQDSGEFLDLFSVAAWEALGEPVSAALRMAAPGGPILDLGAGSGLGTRVIARTLPGAHIVAVEPSAIQRAALFTRIGSEADLRERVTVVAATSDDAPLPDRLGGAIAMNMIGHLPPDRRHELWRRIGKRLTPGAPLVVNAQPPAEAIEVPETVFGSVRFGRNVYQGSGSARPDGPGAVVWRMRYRVLDDAGRVVRETVAAYRWQVISPVSLVAELSEAGFDAELGPLDVVRAVVARG